VILDDPRRAKSRLPPASSALGPAPETDRGYALVAAVAAVAAFAFIAFQVLAEDRGAVASVAARLEQVKLDDAADAAVMVALHGLGADDPDARWAIDGRTRHVDFDGVSLAVAVEDERGKAPLAGLSHGQARALFEGAGASGGRLEALVGEYRSWVGRGPVDAAPATSAVQGSPSATIQWRPFEAVDDLMALADMDAALYGRIAPSVTTFFEQGGPFDPANASPLALETMNAREGAAEQGPASGDFASEQPDETIAPDAHLVGRTLTVRVWARDGNGARTHRMAIVELTGSKTQPYWIRYAE
jgi:hypothetical protein